MFRFTRSVALSGLFAGLAVVATADSFTYTTIDDPLATSYAGTQPSGINDTGQIVGTYFIDGPNGPIAYGFLDSGGVLTTIAGPAGSLSFVAYGINDAGAIAGAVEFPNSSFFGSCYVCEFGFVEEGGTFTILPEMGAYGTSARGIDNEGQIIGVFAPGKLGVGFVDNGGVFTDFAVPSNAEYPFTLANGINDSGVVAVTADTGAYLYSGGTFTPITDPSGTYDVSSATGINNAGQIVGSVSYANAQGQLIEAGYLDNRGDLYCAGRPFGRRGDFPTGY